MASQMFLRFAGVGAKHSLRHRMLPVPAASPSTIKGCTIRSLLVSSSRTMRCFSSEIQPLHEKESFLTGTSSLYAEQMYEQYLENPSSIHPSWKMYFDTIEDGLPYDESAFNKPTAAASSVKRAIYGVRLEDFLHSLFVACVCVCVCNVDFCLALF